MADRCTNIRWGEACGRCDYCRSIRLESKLDTIIELLTAQVDGRRMAETGTGSGRSPTSPVVATSDDAPNLEGTTP